MKKQMTEHTVLGLEIGPRDHVQGPDDAPITLLEYGDFQCPHCGAAHSIVKALQEQFNSSVRFAYRHFPLIEIHPYAEPAAEAAEAAGAQGKFWEMHDTLFEHQGALTPDYLVFYAKQLGLDLVRFTTELARHVHAERIREDLLGGMRAGVHGTPTFFINGTRHEGSYDYDTMVKAIQAQLKNLAT